MALSDKDIEVLKKIYEYELAHLEEWEERERRAKEESNLDIRIGWTWHEVGIHPTKLVRLVAEGILEVVYDSRKKKEYRIKDLAVVKKLIELHDSSRSEVGVENHHSTTETLAIPDDLFDIIEGFDDVKTLIKLALRSEKPIHFLFIGPPATAKSLFLLELERIPGAFYVVGSQTTGAGISEVLLNIQPNILLVDEIEKIAKARNREDLSVLLSVMETGIVKVVKHNKNIQLRLNLRVFAAGNDDKKLPPELLSRFGAYVFHFKPYTEEEYVRITKNFLVKREGIDEEVAEYIAIQTKDSRDVRVARSIARIAKTKEEVDAVLKVVRRYQRDE